MRKLLIMLLLGLTIYFNVEDKLGHIYVNQSPNNWTILVYRSTGTVVMYSDEEALRMSEIEFIKKYGKGIIDSVGAATGFITPVLPKKLPKEAPGIVY